MRHFGSGALLVVTLATCDETDLNLRRAIFFHNDVFGLQKMILCKDLTAILTHVGYQTIGLP